MGPLLSKHGSARRGALEAPAALLCQLASCCCCQAAPHKLLMQANLQVGFPCPPKTHPVQKLPQP